VAKIEIRFICDVFSADYLTVKSVHDRIEVGHYDSSNDILNRIHLDQSTAIKFAKTLRTEINKIK